MTKAIAKRTSDLPAHLLQDRVLQRLNDAEAALQQATTIDEVHLVMAVAAAREVFAKRQQLSEDVLGFAHSLKIRALARLGGLLEDLPKSKGVIGRSKKGLTRGAKGTPRVDEPQTLESLGISKALAKTAAKLSRMPRKTQQAIADRTTTFAKAVREQTKVEQLEKVAALSPTEGVYDVLVVDPPWQYDRQPKDSGMRGEVDYLTASVDELKGRTLPAADDCVLWLWTTNSFMGEAYELAAAWGFTVKTILTWNKVHMGLGSWLRNVTEHCLVCVKGHPVVTLTNQTTLITEARREHSRKPESFYALVESLCPGRKWELFARTPRPGWSQEGVEADRFSVEAMG